MDKHARIETTLVGIESPQSVTQRTLATVQGLSMASFGLLSLSAGLMSWRLSALNKRVTDLGHRIDEVLRIQKADLNAELGTSLKFLDLFEQKERSNDLDVVHEKAATPTATDASLLADEVAGRQRVEVLNSRGRYYALSLMTELNGMVHFDDLPQAIALAERQQGLLRRLVGATYEQTLGKAPEVFLDPSLREAGVSVALMTDLSNQLLSAGILGDGNVSDSEDLFERLREPIYKSRGRRWRVLKSVGRARARYLQQLRYMIACVEDANRVQSLKKLKEASLRRDFSLAELRRRAGEQRAAVTNDGATAGHSGDSVWAFVLPPVGLASA